MTHSARSVREQQSERRLRLPFDREAHSSGTHRFMIMGGVVLLMVSGGLV